MWQVLYAAVVLIGMIAGAALGHLWTAETMKTLAAYERSLRVNDTPGFRGIVTDVRALSGTLTFSMLSPYESSATRDLTIAFDESTLVAGKRYDKETAASRITTDNLGKPALLYIQRGPDGLLHALSVSPSPLAQ